MLNIENKLTLAQEEVALKNFESAIEYIDEILELHPTHKEALWQRILIPYKYYLDIICTDFKVEPHIASSEGYDIDYDLTPNAKKIADMRNQSMYYAKTYFQISNEKDRNDLFVKIDKAGMMRLFRNDLNYLLELDGMVFGSNANVSRLIVEYCNKVYLNDLKHRYEIPESILNLKSYAEANLKQVNSPLFLEVNENFTDTKLWMEKILAEDDEEKRKKKKAEEKGIKKPRLNPVYVFSFLIALIIVMCFVLYKILQRYT
ncbi:MAG: hypothetical protein KBG21_06030 [Ignavibacteria bacterium]|nr:hypothetical protein [Ignavibacteria bacterium]